jgi:ATP-dependent DNA ligase
MRGMEYADLDIRDEAALEPFFLSDEWVAEQKMDGTRAIVRLTATHIEFMHRSGEPLAHTAARQWFDKIEQALLPLANVMGRGEEYIFDGEIIIANGEYRIFDLPSASIRSSGNGGVLPTQPYRQRRRMLDLLDIENDVISIVKMATTEQEKRRLFEQVKEQGAEGLVLKRIDAPYLSGRVSKDVLKAKFVYTADVVVTTWNRPDEKHGSCQFAVYDNDGVLVTVGGCSLIGKPPVKEGDVIEVAYLYWTGASVYQPRLMRVRDDKRAVDCSINQFKAYTRKVL